MQLNLEGKLALVTGASSGIGAATAELLAAEGVDVIVGYRGNEAGADATVAAVESHGRTARRCRMDVADAADVQRAIAQLDLGERGLDILVQSSGVAPVGDLRELPADEWQHVVAVNLNGPFYVLQAVTPFLRDGAAVVNVASVAGQTGVPHQAHYAAAKAGVINLTKSAARALAPRVRVNCVAPGMTLTEMGQITATALPADYAEKKLLLQRFAEPQEIAHCIVFLASGAAGFITGETLNANGGRDLR